MSEMTFWGFFVRTTQSLAQASPFILTGFIVAAVFRRFYGPRRTFELFGANRSGGLLRAWGIGMLLPVCSLGTIPIIREMRRSGLSGGTILAFAISAPLFNPLSLLYGLTLSEPIAILSFAGCSLIIVTLLGVVWDKVFPDSALPVPDEEPASWGVRRIVAVMTSAGKDAVGPSTVYILCGLIACGALGALLPANSLQFSFNHDNPAAPLLMAGFAVPVYATPMLAMSQMGMMFQHANSIGAAFVLLALGAGMNVGLVVWMLLTFKLRKTVVWALMLGGVAIGLAYAVDGPLFPKDVEPAGHTHAFDIYCQPFRSTSPPPRGFLGESVAMLSRKVEFFEWYALKVLGGFLVFGLIVLAVDAKGQVTRWIESGNNDALRKDFVIPSHILGGIVLLSLIALSVVGCYVYYPPVNDVLEELTFWKGELNPTLHEDFSSEKLKTVAHAIENYDDWSRKLEVSMLLRRGHVSEYHHWKARVMREQLELMEHAIEEEADVEHRREWVSRVQRTHSRLIRAFSTELDSE